MKKRIISLILVLCVSIVSVCIQIPIVAYATSGGTCGDNLTWSLDDEGTLTIEGSGSMTNYSTIAPWNEYEYSNKIKKIIVNDGVTSIGTYAFSDLWQVENVYVADSVTQIGEAAFADCRGLSVIRLSNNVTQIHDRTFYNCKNLETIKLPENMRQFGSQVFWGCSALKEVHIPVSCSTIGTNSFYECPLLKDIYYEGTKSQWLSINFYVTSEEDALNTATIHFKDDGPQILYSGSIGSNITWSIDNDAILRIEGTGQMPMWDSSSNPPWESYKSIISKVIISDGITNIGNNALKWCKSLVEVVMGDDIEEIGDYSFWQCEKLENISFPDNLNRINFCAFEGCEKITEINIPAKLENIEYHAFNDCSALKKINVDSNNASYTAADNVLYSKDMKSLCFYPNGKEDTSFDIPSSVTNIYAGAFSGNYNLVSVTIPTGVTATNSAFSYCKNLQKITLPNTLKNIDDFAFQYSEKINGLKIPLNTLKIGQCAFRSCCGLTNIYIPASVLSIDEYAFYQCTGLNTIYYYGSEEDWKKISIADGNDDLHKANIIYNYIDETETGDGTKENPYLIYNEEQLKGITNYSHYKLMSDITLSEPWIPIERFVGNFDGNGFKITNLQCPADWNGENYGLFSEIVDSKISNLTVGGNITISENNEITRLGLIAGFNDSSTVNNCTATGSIQIRDSFNNYWYEDVGGLFGMSLYASITNCTNECSVNADCENAGGIVGNTGFETTISQCKNIANITGGRTGGITALTDSKTTIELSYNIGNISTSSDSGAGGIVGESNSSIRNCYNTGDITNEHWCAGGIVAYDMNNMFNVYNIGDVSANGDFGAIDGFTDNCCDSSTWYYLNNGSICGIGNNDSPSNENKTIALSQEQMKQKESYPTFDFETIWNINPEINDGYPYLRCFYEETTIAEFGISSADSGVAGTWYSFDVEFTSLPTSAYLQFDAPDDDWNWLSEEYCMNHETFKIYPESLTEKDGKYAGKVTLIIYSTGNSDDNYNRAVRINADFAGEKKQSEILKFKVEPIPEKPNRSFGNLYEQTSDPQEIDVYPQILSVSVQKDRGQYLMKVESFIAKNKDNVFFYWETDNGEFTGTSNKYDVAKLNAPEGATVTVTMGDGYGYISTKTIKLDPIKGAK